MGDGLLVGVIPKHHPLQPVLRHKVTDALDDAFRVRLIHGQHLHVGRHVEEVLLLPSPGQRHLAGVAHQDNGDAEAAQDVGQGHVVGRGLGDGDVVAATASPALLSP